MNLTSLTSREILGLRGDKNRVSKDKAYAALVEKELSAERRIVDAATVFLANKECPFRCLMCDLWKNTLDETVPSGAIRKQIDEALDELPRFDHLKLYNSGNFWDAKAIPASDLDDIAEVCSRFEKTIVECHPKLIDESCLDFKKTIDGPLEVAMGLETVHEKVLESLNKQMNADDFRASCGFLRENDVSVRTFVLLRPPYMNEEEGVEWAIKSVEYALESGSQVVAVIPTRSGNGAVDLLEKEGLFAKPSLKSLETVIDHFVPDPRGVVTADTWDLELFSSCTSCFPTRLERLERLNLEQLPIKRVECECSP